MIEYGHLIEFFIGAKTTLTELALYAYMACMQLLNVHLNIKISV